MVEIKSFSFVLYCDNDFLFLFAFFHHFILFQIEILQVKPKFIKLFQLFIQQHSIDDQFNEIFHDTNISQKKTKKKLQNHSIITNIDQHENELLIINGHFFMCTAMHKCLKALEFEKRLKFSK